MGAGDVPRIVSLLSDELALTEAERFPYYGGVWRWPQEVLENLFVPLSRDWEMFSVTPKNPLLTASRSCHSAAMKASTGRQNDRYRRRLPTAGSCDRERSCSSISTPTPRRAWRRLPPELHDRLSVPQLTATYGLSLGWPSATGGQPKRLNVVFRQCVQLRGQLRRCARP